VWGRAAGHSSRRAGIARHGLRTIINDYTRRDATRFWLKSLLYTATTIVIALGTLVIFTFDPNI
jgi:succinate dehydrogenase / fumarate reductase, membrane anchor subunit